MLKLDRSLVIVAVVVWFLPGCSEDSTVAPQVGPSFRELLDAPNAIQLDGEIVDYSGGGYLFTDRVEIVITARVTRDASQAASGLKVTGLWAILNHQVGFFNAPVPVSDAERQSGSNIERLITFHQETYHQYRAGAELFVVLEFQDDEGNSAMVRTLSVGLIDRGN